MSTKILIYILIVLSVYQWAYVIAYADEEEEVTISSTIQGLTPSPTPTTAPTATPTSTPTPTGSATPTSKPSEKGLIIFGYAPANSYVEMSGIGVSEKTNSNISGYFEFSSLPFPTLLSGIAGFLYPELCFRGIDLKGKTTSVNCIPALPFKAPSTRIGPVLLSPTIGIENNVLYKGDIVKSGGITVPGSSVEIYLARKNLKYLTEIVKDVGAYNLPTYQVTANEEGYYEFNLPNNVADNWKIYSAAIVQGANTPKSNTLSFSVRPGIYKLTKIYQTISYYIVPVLYFIFIALEFGVILILIVSLRKLDEKYKIKKGKTTKHPKTIKKLVGEYAKVQAEYEELLKQKGLI